MSETTMMHTATLTIMDLDMPDHEAAARALLGAKSDVRPIFVEVTNADGVRKLVKVEEWPEDIAGELLAELKRAESFMSGFEDDDMQDGIGERLASMRALIAKAEGRSNG